jgi:hypothetical protein
LKLVFHRDVYLPASLVTEVRSMDYARLNYSRHAIREALEDGLGAQDLPQGLRLDDWVLIHVETWSGAPSGILVRRPLPRNPRLHIVLAVSFPRGDVKTVWVNRADDNHRTLDRTKYVSAP